MNRNFLVTGGAQGLGYQFCRKILGGGGRVYMADIDETKGKETIEELQTEFGKGKIAFGVLDVRKKEDWDQVWSQAETFFGGQVQGFCNNAGIFHETDWMKVKEINMDGMLYGAMLAYDRMGVKNGGEGGLMVITGSMASFLADGFDSAQGSVYSVSKFAVGGLVRSQSSKKIYNIDKVRTVGICPWFVDTNLVRTNTSVGVIESTYKMRVLQPEEVGNAFERLVVEGRPGDMLTVMPGTTFFWPNWNRKLIVLFVMASKISRKVFGISSENIITEQDFLKIGVVTLFLVFLLFHWILSWIGL